MQTIKTTQQLLTAHFKPYYSDIKLANGVWYGLNLNSTWEVIPDELIPQPKADMLVALLKQGIKEIIAELMKYTEDFSTEPVEEGGCKGCSVIDNTIEKLSALYGLEA